MMIVSICPLLVECFNHSSFDGFVVDFYISDAANKASLWVGGMSANEEFVGRDISGCEIGPRFAS